MFTMVRPESDGTKRRRGTLRLPGWPCGAVHEAFLRRCKPDQVQKGVSQPQLGYGTPASK